MTTFPAFVGKLTEAIAECEYQDQGLAAETGLQPDLIGRLRAGDFTTDELTDDDVDRLASALVQSGKPDHDREALVLAMALFQGLGRVDQETERRRRLRG